MIQQLAATFYAAISDAVTSDELEQIKLLNKLSRSPTSCAVHDFCDANHYLLASYEELLGHECDMTDSDLQVMSKAADYAHKHFFQ
ncbi:hypothetical protein UFOVP167_49 [uncultured Caudovirales phage]|uniref:Uncharacterized protein n=1 Tax=uncultured Caudovirales phage TaxID=2100421 RepID=A0A6J7WD28_9CAUD|nr:hypothetical protein UFOVP167_49 [uncultured Caudovirales phage]